jgi:outer membrane protein assembly factor BamB
MKKWIKIMFLIAGLILVAVIVVAVMYRDTIGIMLGNRKVQPHTAMAHDIATAPVQPITRGEADWKSWRNINGDNRSYFSGIKRDWSNGLRKVWEIDYLCDGEDSATWSAPVVLGNRLVVCGREGKNDVVYCLNPEDGGLIWKQAYPSETSNEYGTGFRATPWIDDDRVYTYGRGGDLSCWNLLNGEKIWHKNVRDAGGEEPTWGLSSSPLVTGSLVIVSGGGAARTIAYDKMTGEIMWKAGQGHAGYAAITMMEIDGEPVVLSFHGKGLAAITLNDGKILWDIEWQTNYDVNATTPVVKDNLVFITSGYKTGSELLRVTKSGAEIVWKNRDFASHHSDPFIIGNYIYGYSGDSMQNKGFFKCLELETGAEKWSTKEMGWGTCIAVEDYLLCKDVKGSLYLMRPDPEKFIKVTGMNKVWGKVSGATWTKPILANGRLYLRFKQGLMCLDIKG